jgi:uncharacterized membrane protein
VNSLAIASLVSALIFPFWPLSSIAGVVLAIVSLRQLRQRSSERGTGIAVAGLVIGLAVLVLSALVAAVFLYFGYECRHGC